MTTALGFHETHDEADGVHRGRAGFQPAVPGILPGTPKSRPMRRVEYPARRVTYPPYPRHAVVASGSFVQSRRLPQTRWRHLGVRWQSEARAATPP